MGGEKKWQNRERWRFENGPVKDRVLVPYRQAVFSVFSRAHLSKVFGGSVDEFAVAPQYAVP